MYEPVSGGLYADCIYIYIYIVVLIQEPKKQTITSLLAEKKKTFIFWVCSGCYFDNIHTKPLSILRFVKNPSKFNCS